MCVYATGELLGFSVYICVLVYATGEPLGFSIYISMLVYAPGEWLGFSVYISVFMLQVSCLVSVCTCVGLCYR